MPRSAHLNHLLAFSPAQIQSFAAIMGEVTLRYDNLFECSFPYSMGLHQRPLPPRKASSLSEEQKIEEMQWDEAQFHVHFYPPLLRSKTVKKFQVSTAFRSAFLTHRLLSCMSESLPTGLLGRLRDAWRATARLDR